MSTELREKCSVFVKYLDASVTDAALREAFSTVGTVTEARLVAGGRGIVQFADEEAARRARQTLHNSDLAGRKIVVISCHQQRRGQQEHDGAGTVGMGTGKASSAATAPSAAAPGYCNVYVKGFDEHTTEEKLLELFSPYGDISSAVVIKDVSGKPRGFGFVNFIREEEALNAISAMDGYAPATPGGTPWSVSRAQTKAERQQEAAARQERERLARAERQAASNLYVKNLEATIDDARLKELFSEFGDVRSCRVLRDDDGNSRSVGFVQFNSIEEAQSAIQGMNGRQVGARKVYVQVAQRKAERDKKAAVAAAALKALESGMGVVPGAAPGEEHVHPAFMGMPYYPAAMAQPYFFGGPPVHMFAPPPFQAVPGLVPAAHVPMQGIPAAALGPHGGYFVYPTGAEGLTAAAAAAFPPYPHAAAGNAVAAGKGGPMHAVVPGAGALMPLGVGGAGPGVSSAPSLPTGGGPSGKGGRGGRPGSSSAGQGPGSSAGGGGSGGKAAGEGGAPGNGAGGSSGGGYRGYQQQYEAQNQQHQHGSGRGAGQRSGSFTRAASTGASSTSSLKASGGSKSSSPEGSGLSSSSTDNLAASLQSASPDERNTLLGEALFPKIATLTGDPNITPKVTGMLLELGVVEVLRMVEEPETLKRQVNEAIKCLQKQFALPVPVPVGGQGGGAPRPARLSPPVAGGGGRSSDANRLAQGMQGLGLAA